MKRLLKIITMAIISTSAVINIVTFIDIYKKNQTIETLLTEKKNEQTKSYQINQKLKQDLADLSERLTNDEQLKQAQLNIEKDKVTKLETEKAKALEDLNKANTAKTNAERLLKTEKDKVTKLETEKAKALEDLNKANTAKTNAERLLKTEKDKIAKLEAEKLEAENNLSQANTAKTNAERLLKAEKAKVTKIETEKAKTLEDLNKANTAKTNAERLLKAEKDKIAKLEAEKLEAKNNLSKVKDKDIKNFIVKTDLGKIYVLNKDKKLAIIEIKEKLKILNPKLQINEIEIIFKEDGTSALIISNNDKTYSGFVTISFEIMNFVKPTYFSKQGNFNHTEDRSVAINSSGDIFVGGKNGKVCKIPQNKNLFVTDLSGVNGNINVIKIDKNDTIYVGSTDGNIYRCLKGQDSFKVLKGASEEIYSLTINTDGTIYAGSAYGNIYTFLQEKDTFANKINLSNYSILSLINDKEGTIYAGGQDGCVYRLLKGETKFTKLFDSKQYIRSFAIDSQGNLYMGVQHKEKCYSLYKLAYKEMIFKPIENFSTTVSSLTIDIKDNIYVGFEGWTGSDAFVLRINYDEKIRDSVRGSDQIRSLAINTNGILFAVNHKGELFKADR